MIVPPMSFVTVTPTIEEHGEQPKSKIIQSAMKGGRRRTRPSQDHFVTFDSDVDVHEIPHLRDISKEEIAATWYNNEDFEEIKRAIVTTLRLMIAKKPIGSDQCSRGLEFRTPMGAKLRKKNKLEALTAVWNAQVAQWKDNITDDEAIRMVYLEQSLKCREVAIKFGVQDEKAVRGYLGNNEDSDSSFSSIESTIILDNKPKETSDNIEIVKQSCVPSAA
jgi:hypothetical protein